MLCIWQFGGLATPGEVANDSLCSRDKLVVRLTAERSCWVALSSHVAAQLLSQQQPLPLALELRIHGGGNLAKRVCSVGSDASPFHK